MANIPFRVAKRGFELYKETSPPPSLDKVNRALEAEGLDHDVSERTYDHYGRLRRHGFEEYIPTNQLDVMVKMQRAAS